jgi:hypothetical protein
MAPQVATAEASLEETHALDNQAVIRGPGQ